MQGQITLVEVAFIVNRDDNNNNETNILLPHAEKARNILEIALCSKATTSIGHDK